MHRHFLAVGLAVMALGLWAAPALADEGWVIQRFASDITVQKDASLHITEAIDVDFGSLQKHGIFRTIPVRYQWDDTHLRVYQLQVRSVTDGSEKSVRYETSDQGGSKVIKIGDPNRTVSGRQTYRITYDVSGAMNPFPDHDELFWNVNGGLWDVRAQAVTATVHAPAAPQQATCYQGAAGSDEVCRFTITSSGADFAATRPLAPRGQLTIVASLAKGVVAEPRPIIARDGDNLLAYFEPQPLWLALAVFALAGGLAFLYWRWYTVGRDARERETIVPEYEPPDKIRPAQLGVILDESADTKDVTATIVDLAVRGYLTIAEEPQPWIFAKKDWTLHATGKTLQLLPYEEIVYGGLFKDGADVKVSELRTHFISSLRSAEDELYRDSADRKWFATRPDRVRQGYAGVSVLAIIAGVGITWLLGKTLGAGLVGVAVVLVGIVALAVARIMPAKTAAGAELLRRSLGFRQYMEVAEKERQRFAERENIFSEYLPYAIVFGCVEKWARAFKDIDMSAQTSSSWYVGSGPFNAGILSSSLMGFSSNLGSAISSTPGSSGGSGFSGGGGAGGGGGGGGGGSW